MKPWREELLEKIENLTNKVTSLEKVKLKFYDSSVKQIEKEFMEVTKMNNENIEMYDILKSLIENKNYANRKTALNIVNTAFAMQQISPTEYTDLINNYINVYYPIEIYGENSQQTQQREQ